MSSSDSRSRKLLYTGLNNAHPRNQYKSNIQFPSITMFIILSNMYIYIYNYDQMYVMYAYRCMLYMYVIDAGMYAYRDTEMS